MKALKTLLSVILLCMALVALSPSGGGWAAPPYLFVFNMDSDDVTIIDPTTHQVLGTRPVGFKVKWLAGFCGPTGFERSGWVART